MGIGMRLMAVSGQFYPGKEAPLKQKIEEAAAIARQDEIAVRPVRALILPHAGYDYSAVTAVKGLLSVDKSRIKRVVVLSPSHRHGFYGAAAGRYDGYWTPFDAVQCDMNALDTLLDTPGSPVKNMPEAHQGEHAIEVQLPLLQYFLDEFTLIPLVIGQNNLEQIRQIADALAPFWGPETLWVISSDFTHFGRSFGYLPFTTDIRAGLRKLDMGAIDRILALDTKGFYDYVRETGATICGHAPIEILLALLDKHPGEVRSELIDYTNTGEMFLDFSHSVSYAAISFSEV